MFMEKFNILEQPTNTESEKTLSIDYWKALIIDGEKDRFDELSQKYLECIETEKTNMVSGVMERFCNLKCAHCLYNKNHTSSQQTSENAHLTETITNMVRQLPQENELSGRKPSFLHEGRILRPWHLEIFKTIKTERPDVSIGLIDNGSYVEHIKELQNKGIALDWLDISIDGTEKSHNLQRDPEMMRAYETAIDGLRHAREITKPTHEGGKVSSLFTVTKLNYKDILETAETLFQPNPETSAFDSESGNQLNYVDSFHITTMSPALPENFPIEIDVDEMKIVWEQIQEMHLFKESPQISFKLYRIEDLEKLAAAVGEKKFWEAITSEDDTEGYSAELGYMRFYIDHTPVYYYPISAFPLETIVIDADAVSRSAYFQQFSLEELKKDESATGINIEKYSWAQLDAKSSYSETYKTGVEKWWKYFGKTFLEKEMEAFDRIHNKARTNI